MILVGYQRSFSLTKRKEKRFLEKYGIIPLRHDDVIFVGIIPNSPFVKEIEEDLKKLSMYYGFAYILPSGEKMIDGSSSCVLDELISILE